MMRSMFAGVSGLRNHQIKMDAIGNNIANVNTVGYKSSRVNFQDTLSQILRGSSAPSNNRGGINAVQVGLGMNLASIDIYHTQGNLQNTGRITDLAIQGDGMFVLSDGARQYFSRAGNFTIERDGRLVNAANGLVVQGWMADQDGVLNTNSPIEGIQLPLGRTIAPRATTNVEFEGNLASNTNVNLEYLPLTLTDSTGHTCTVTFKLTPVGFNTYEYVATVPPEYGSITAGTGTGRITLNENGVVTGSTGAFFEVTPINGTPMRVDPPQLNRLLGDTFVAHPTGTNQQCVLTGFTGAGLPATYLTTVRDVDGNALNLTYTVTTTGIPNEYRWTLSPEMPLNNCTVESGNTGTFTWTAAEGITKVSAGTSVVHSNVAPTGMNVTINPPCEMLGVPTFSVVERVPATIPQQEANTAPPLVVGDSGVIDVPITDPVSGELLTTLHFNATLVGVTTYDFSVTADGGTVLEGGSGQFDWDNGTGETTNFNPAAGASLRVKLNNGVSVAIEPFGGPVGVVGDNPIFQDIRVVGGKATGVICEIPNPVITMTKVYDSLGRDHILTTTAEKIGDNSWRWTTKDQYDNYIGNGTLMFSNQGRLISSTGGPLTFNPVGGALPMSIAPDFGELSQYKGEWDDQGMAISSFTSPHQDGYGMGEIQSFNIDKSGRIVGIFSNGINQNLAQVAVAVFTNPAGLTRTGETLFQESSNSGTAQIGQAGVGGWGMVTPGAIEMSNVDLSQEFTDMIVTQRGFQANSRIITTSDEMLQELVNLKR